MSKTSNSGDRQTFRRVDRDCFDLAVTRAASTRLVPPDDVLQLIETMAVNPSAWSEAFGLSPRMVWPVVCPLDPRIPNSSHEDSKGPGTLQMSSYRRVFEGFGAISIAELGVAGGAQRSARAEAATAGSYGLALADERTQAYNEEAFRYFLEIERKRSELSQHPFLLLLIDFKKDGTSAEAIDDVSGKLFASLSLCVRDTDFIGWYRNGRVAGAVLTQHGDVGSHDIPEVVGHRVSTSLRAALPSHVADRVQVRVYQLPATAKGEIHG